MACCWHFIMRVTRRSCCRVFPYHRQETFGNHTLNCTRLGNPKMGPTKVAPDWRDGFMAIRATAWTVVVTKLCVSKYYSAPAGNYRVQGPAASKWPNVIGLGTCSYKSLDLKINRIP